VGDCRQAALAEGLVASSEIPKSPRFGATGIRPFFLGGDQIDRVTRHKLYSIASSVLLAALIPAILAGTALRPQWTVSCLLESRCCEVVRAHLLQFVFVAGDLPGRGLGPTRELVAAIPPQSALP